MDIIDAILAFKEDSAKLISDFSVFEENDPITPVKMSFLRDAVNFWIEILGETVKQYNSYLNSFSKKNTTTLQNYNQDINNLNNSLTNNIKKITNEYIVSCNKLKQKIENLRNKTSRSIEQLELDYNYFITTSEQNKEILELDFEEAKRRFDYQKDEAKNSYDEIVKKNNKLLEFIKDELTKNFNEDVESYAEENSGIIIKLKQIIETRQNELKSLNKALENEKNDMKERYRLESTNLNDNIKKIADEKNKIIDKAKIDYSKSTNEITIEKENNKQIYQSQAQALLKEFVTKINEIDENTSAIRKEYEDKIDKIKKEYYYNVFKKTKTFHKQLETIYSSTDSATIDKYTSNLIKFKNKEHLNDIEIYKKETKNKLYALTKELTLKVLENRNTKNFLEIDKNFAIGNLTTQEQYDNKFYQEKSNIYENEYNNNVIIANYQFSQKANLLRCQSQIRTKLLERNYNGIEANYYKKIESLQTKINSLLLEIRLTEQLSHIIKGYQENNYINKLHLESVMNLLEIERNKLLNDFNKNKYEFIIKNFNLSKNYGFKKIDLENQKNLAYRDLKIKLENILLEKNTAHTAFRIKHEELNERFAKMKIHLINNNDLRTSKQKYLSRLKRNDLSYLESVVNSHTIFFDSYKRNLLNVINIILKDIYPTDDNYSYIEKFVNSFLTIFMQLNQNFTLAVKEIIIKALDSRINYIYKFKYKSSIDSIKEDYSNQIKEIKEKRTIILDNIDSANKTIENFKQKIYTLINDNEMISSYQKLKKDHPKYSSIKENELKIKEYREKIENFYKVIKLNNEDLNSLNTQKAAATKKYKKELNQINNLRHKDTKLYEEYRTKIQYGYNIFLKEFNTLSLNMTKLSKNKKKLINNINSKREAINKFIVHNKIILKKEFNKFYHKIHNEIDTKNTIDILEFKKEIRKYEKQRNNANIEYKKEFKLNLESHSKKLHEHNLHTAKTLKYHDNLLNKAKIAFEKDSSNINNINNKVIDNFFNSFYALEDNKYNIIKYHKNLSSVNDNNYKNDKNTSVKRNYNDKIEITNKLNNFIKQKNQEVEQLPQTFKFNSRMINNETKKKNLQINSDIRKQKSEFNTNKRRIEKELSQIKNQLAQEKNNNEIKQKQNIILERKNHMSNVKNAIKNIKITL